MSDPAHPLTLWLARASVACYIAALIAISRHGNAEQIFRQWRAVWSAACLLLLVHVLAAFHFEHGWSHLAALQHTAEQTARVTGINWGGGLYFNYAFLALWLFDLAFLWKASTYRRSALRRTTDIACIFMVVNATVVFGPVWWVGPVGITGLFVLMFYRRTTARAWINPISDD